MKHFLDRAPNWVLKLGINLWPPFLGSGISVVSISKDFRTIKVNLKSRRLTKNYVGTQFGGSMFSMTDPFYMLILLRNLGKEYIVWDKASFIEFKKPARGKLCATFTFSDEEIAAIREQANQNRKYVFDKPVDIFNSQHEVVASVIKTIFVKRKDKLKSAT